MSEKLCVRYIVIGRVQGVWFRASTQDRADTLGLTGWARNLPDGSVEVIASGHKDKLQELHAWLHQGPELADVIEVRSEELPWQEFERFAIK